MLKSKEGARAKVAVLQDVLISCKGQVFQGGRSSTATVYYDGCSYSDGTCVWNSDAGHISRTPYCVPGLTERLCVPHGPGPSEADNQSCRERTISECPGVAAGPLDVVVVLTQPQWGAYFHFLVDSLSRVAWMWQQHPAVVADNRTLFHTGKLDEVAQEWARLAGIETRAGDGNRLLDGWWRARTAYFPPSNGCMNWDRGSEPFAVQQLRAMVTPRAMQGAPPPAEAPAPTALIFRRDASKPGQTRGLVNHDEVVGVVKAQLATWSVEVISDYPETPMPRELCRRVQGADLVMGPHGAGFANLICAKQGTVLLEFQQKDHSWDFEKLSMKLGLPYVGMEVLDMDHWSTGTVDLLILREALAKAVAMSRRAAGAAPAAEPLPASPAAAPALGAQEPPLASSRRRRRSATPRTDDQDSAAEEEAATEAASAEGGAEAPPAASDEARASA
ncbi:unnamed protein product, partial [Prorocentrum cordatum]